MIGASHYFSNISRIDDGINKGQHFDEDNKFLGLLYDNLNVAFLKMSESMRERSKEKTKSRGKRKRHSLSPPNQAKRNYKDASSNEGSASKQKDLRDKIKASKENKRSRSRSRRRRRSVKSSSRSRSRSKSRGRSRGKSIVVTFTRSRSRSRGESSDKEVHRKKKCQGKKRRNSSSSRSSSSSSGSSSSPAPKKRGKDKKSKKKGMKKRSEPDKQSKSIKDVGSRNYAVKERSKQESKSLHFEEETKAIQTLLREKKMYLDNPSSHPQYDKQWKLFWTKKHSRLGEKVNEINLVPDWKICWRTFIDAEYKRIIGLKKRELEIKFNMDAAGADSSVASPSPPPSRAKIATETITLSGESDDEDIVHLDDDCPSTSTSHQPEVRGRTSELLRPSFRSTTIKSERGKSDSISGSYQVPEDDLNVLSLLKILSALQSKGLVGNLGDRIQRMKDFALTLEDGRHGSSQLLVDERECFTTVDAAGEALQLGLASRQVPEIHRGVVEHAAAQIKLFLQKSNCQRSDILEVASFSPVRSEDLAETKMKIAQTIENELKNCNRIISQEEFNKLVEAEYVRVKYKLNSAAAPQSAAFNSSLAATMFSAYTQPPPQFPPQLPPQLGAGPSWAPAPAPAPAGPAGGGRVDWDHVIRALEAVKKQEVAQPLEPEYSCPATELSEDEIVSLIKNIKQIDDSDKRNLLEYMKQLEKLDPQKVKRINRKVIDSR